MGVARGVVVLELVDEGEGGSSCEGSIIAGISLSFICLMRATSFLICSNCDNCFFACPAAWDVSFSRMPLSGEALLAGD